MSEARPTENRATRVDPIRWGWFLLGLITFGIGGIGLVVPLLPTTIFWIVAAWCFGKSCPVLQERIYAHPQVGAPVRNFAEHGVISRRGKLMATTGISAGYLVYFFLSTPGAIPAGLVATLLAGVVLFLWSRPTEIRT